MISTELALAWAIQPADATALYWRGRLSIVRGFARELNEPGQFAPVAFELVAERAAERQVIVDCLKEIAHDSLPGHASASRDRALWSTLAYIAVVSMLWWRNS